MDAKIIPYDQKKMVNVEDQAMSIDGLLGQVRLIQSVMSKVMKPDEHYGTIPGTDKPTLLKPGAEKLCLTFRLDPEYEIIREVREKDFIAYTVKCLLVHIPTGQSVASGIGSCNSRESKYRYKSENTGKPVPKEYWDSRDADILGGSQFKPRKKDSQWVIFEQIENDNPWDLDNTLVKMACKRSLIAATLNATAASDIFTQDIEDMPRSNINSSKTQTEAPSSNTPSTKGGKPISEAQRKKLYAMSKAKELSDKEVEMFANFLKTKVEIMIVNDEKTITMSAASDIFDNFDKYFDEFIAQYPPADDIPY